MGEITSNEHKGILKGDTFSFIAVDNFTNEVVLNASVFFLTHYHSDHYEGLIYKRDAENVGRIFAENPGKLFYCSDITKRIFESDRGEKCFIPPEQIKSEPVGQPFSIYGKRKDNKEIVVTVTFVPTGHILGAVMILFEYENERVLFTGDFRIHPEDVRKVKALHDRDGNMKTITHLYLDTTFASAKYSSFPLRSEVSKFVADIASKWLSKSPKNVVHLNLPYKFAYENLVVDVGEHLKCKVMFSCDTYKRYYRYVRELNTAVFSPGSINFNSNNSRIHACVGSGNRTKILNSCEFCPREKHHVWLIRPSAKYFSNDKKDYKLFFEECDKFDIIRVPYSAHCSLEELQAFVKYVRPKEITTIVEDNDDFRNNILSLIKPSKVNEVEVPCDEDAEDSSLFLNLSDSDYCNSDDSSSESPPW